MCRKLVLSYSDHQQLLLLDASHTCEKSHNLQRFIIAIVLFNEVKYLAIIILLSHKLCFIIMACL